MNGTSPRGRDWTGSSAGPALLAIACLLVFARTLGGGFVWDDHTSVEGNPAVQDLGAWLRPSSPSAATDAFGYARPLRTLEFALDHAAAGNAPLVFRVHSLLWHVVAAVLLLLVLRRLLGDPRAALLAALFWALHPAQVEPVAWISSRGDVAMGACCLAAILLALRSRGYDRDLAGSLALAAAALLYKETAIALPVVLALLRWTKHSRAPLGPYVALGAAYFVGRKLLLTGPVGLPVTFVLGGSTSGTFATMIRGFGFYLADAMLPAQSLDWHLPPSTMFADGAVIAWLLVHGALVTSAVTLRTRTPLWTLAVGVFYAFLLPVANWPFPVGIPTAERYLYLPLAGAAIAFGFALTRARRAIPAALVIVATLGAASAVRGAMWRSDDALWDAVRDDHESPRAVSYGTERLRPEGIGLLSRAEAMPEGAEQRETAERGRRLLQQALDDAHAALDLWCRFEGTASPVNAFAAPCEVNASNLCWLLGRDEEALFHAEEAIRLDGHLPHPHYDRALALLRLGFAPQAVASMERARELGFSGPDATIGAFFVAAARKCDAMGLVDIALRAYADAPEFLPPGGLRETAAAEIEALRRLPAPAAGAQESTLAASDAQLAAVPRRCPSRRVFIPAK